MAAYSETSFIIYITVLIILLSLYITLGTYFLRKFYQKKKKQGTEVKTDYLYLVHGAAIILLGIGRLFLVIFDLITEFDSSNYAPNNFWIWKVGSCIQMAALCLFLITMEKRILKGKDKYLLVILFLAVLTIGMVMIDINIATNFIIIASIFTIFIPFAYLYVAIISEGEVRKKASYVFIGFSIFMIAALLTGEMIIDHIAQPLGLTRIDVHVIAYTIKISCLIFFFLGFK